ncbi:MAG: long-chain-acyl-CoA synthetase [Desulfobacterales bacterium]|nr:long-chain-acyl-CoA synthetase [Desulfobacterales bacterium]
MTNSITPVRTFKKLQKRIFVSFKSAQNAMELLRRGRLCAPYQAPFDIYHSTNVYKLRRYFLDHEHTKPTPNQPVIILVPPLMVATEIYDISPELSSIAFLIAQGVDVWVVDFGAPEHEDGGMQRTLDDHVLAVDDAISFVQTKTGNEIHLAGYSQGGMFVYQCAAFRKSRGLRSIITFGSPVDLHKNIPKVVDKVVEKILDGTSKILSKPLSYFEGLPGTLSSAGFKVLSGRKEIKQVIEFFAILHDRNALIEREPRRRFLAGEGFVAWPGPALQKFFEDVLVKNRMVTGGLVINKQPVSLADIRCPILYFVGTTDDFARVPSVRAIKKAAPNTRIYEVELHCGHFGLVVGSKSLRITWPTVVKWMKWIEGYQDMPDFYPEKHNQLLPETDTLSTMELMYDVATENLDKLWHRLGDASLEIAQMIDTLRWQLPRFAQVKQLTRNVRVNIGRALEEQALAIPDSVFFLWNDKAFTYHEANDRVSLVTMALFLEGVKPKQHIGILMNNCPDFLSALAAINRIGAIAVLINAGQQGESLKHALVTARVEGLIIDPEHISVCNAVDMSIPVWVLSEPETTDDSLSTSLAYLNPSQYSLDDIKKIPYKLNATKANDVIMIIFTSGTTGLPKAVKITNRRWCAAALSAAAVADITTKDTVYCPLPLHHATGILIAVSGALLGGARLALSNQFSASHFWDDVRRYGATICCYVGEMCRYLLKNPESPSDSTHPVRLFTGNGIHKDIWKPFQKRFAIPKIIEFYASTEGNVHLVNLNPKKIGAVGRPLDDQERIKLIRYDRLQSAIIRDELGNPIECKPDEHGLLIARIDESHPLSTFEGYLDVLATEEKILRDLFNKGDAWFSTGDILYRDNDGDYWFIDRIGDTFRWKSENVSTLQVASVINQLQFIAIAACYGVSVPGHEGRVGVVAVELRQDHEFNGQQLYSHVRAHLTASACPRVVRVVSKIETTPTMKFKTYMLQQEGIDPQRIQSPLFIYDSKAKTYRPMKPEDYPESIE